MPSLLGPTNSCPSLDLPTPVRVVEEEAAAGVAALDEAGEDEEVVARVDAVVEALVVEVEEEEALVVEVDLAEAGAVVVCGGRGGVMEGAARGAAEGGGLSVGILPGTSHSEANPWISIPLPTGLGEARNAVVVRAAEAVVAVGGSWGTLSEVALAAKMDVPVSTIGRAPKAVDDVLSHPDADSAAAWAVRAALEARSGR